MGRALGYGRLGYVMPAKGVRTYFKKQPGTIVSASALRNNVPAGFLTIRKVCYVEGCSEELAYGKFCTKHAFKPHFNEDKLTRGRA